MQILTDDRVVFCFFLQVYAIACTESAKVYSHVKSDKVGPIDGELYRTVVRTKGWFHSLCWHAVLASDFPPFLFSICLVSKRRKSASRTATLE